MKKNGKKSDGKPGRNLERSGKKTASRWEKTQEQRIFKQGVKLGRKNK